MRCDPFWLFGGRGEGRRSWCSKLIDFPSNFWTPKTISFLLSFASIEKKTSMAYICVIGFVFLFPSLNKRRKARGRKRKITFSFIYGSDSMMYFPSRKKEKGSRPASPHASLLENSFRSINPTHTLTHYQVCIDIDNFPHKNIVLSGILQNVLYKCPRRLPNKRENKTI